MSYWLHPEAEAELGEAAVYYAEHASRAVAEAFLAEFERVRDFVVERTKRAGRMRTMACASITSIGSPARSFTNPPRLVHISMPSLISTESRATGPSACSSAGPAATPNPSVHLTGSSGLRPFRPAGELQR